MNVLLILNDPPYGTERSFNGLRQALALSKLEDVDLRVFLVGDAVACAMANQQLPQGYYNVQRMIEAVARRGADVGCCGSCLEARGIADGLLAAGARRASMDELADWTVWADKVVTW